MNKKIIITAGGTSEQIDSVRKITNVSTGKLGCTICTELLETKKDEIDKIYYLCPTNAIIPVDHEKVEVVTITDTNSLKENVEYLLKNNKIDYFIHGMAVSDYTTDSITNAKMLATYISRNIDKDLEGNDLANQIESLIKNNMEVIDSSKKVSSYEDNLIINLKQTPKIISMIKDLSKSTYLVGFKLLNNVTEQELCDVAYRLLEKNRCDIVVANDLSKIKEDNHEAILINKTGEKVYADGKQDIARKLINIMWNNTK